MGAKATPENPLQNAGNVFSRGPDVAARPRRQSRDSTGPPTPREDSRLTPLVATAWVQATVGLLS
jgi:hypothetical protein